MAGEFDVIYHGMATLASRPSFPDKVWKTTDGGVVEYSRGAPRRSRYRLLKPKRFQSCREHEYATGRLQHRPLLQAALPCHDEPPGYADTYLRHLMPPPYTATTQQPIDDAQMFAGFFESYYPLGIQLRRNLTYLRTLMDYPFATGGLLEQAIRTVGLTHLATISNNTRFQHKACVAYGQLLRQLQLSFKLLPNAQHTTDQIRELVSAVALLTHINDATPSTDNRNDSWTTHLWAAQYLLTTYVSSLPGSHPLEQGLARHAIGSGLHLALAQRRTPPVDKAWLFNLEPTSGTWPRTMLVYCELSRLLEATDRALSQSHDAGVLQEILTNLRRIKVDSASLFPETATPAIMTPNEMEHLDPAVEEHIAITSSSVSIEMFAPMKVETAAGSAEAIKFITTTLISLIVECTMLRIWHFRPETARRAEQLHVEKDASKLARSLCQVSLSFTSVDKLVYALTLRLCLLLARNVFEQQGKWAEVGWCEACLIANQLRRKRIQPMSTPTLCKVEDVTPGIAEAGRYKEAFDTKAFVVRGSQARCMRLLE